MEKTKETKEILVTAYPYATVSGRVSAPKDLEGEALREWLVDNWDEIAFGEPDLDFAGTEFDVD